LSKIKYETLGYHQTVVRVPFGYVDGYGYLWHGHIANFFEIARADLVREFGLSAKECLENDIAVPMVRFEVDYLAPAFDDEELIIEITLLKPNIPLPYLNFDYHIRRIDSSEYIVSGQTKQVFIKNTTHRPLIRMPKTTRNNLNLIWNYLAGQQRKDSIENESNLDEY